MSDLYLERSSWIVDYGHVLDNLATTACILTTHLNGRDSGSLVTTVMSCNLRHVRLLVGTWQGSLTHELIDTSRLIGLNVLGPQHVELVELFGKRSGRDVNKFTGDGWIRGATGVLILNDALGYVEGRVIDKMNCGDHTLRLVDPIYAVWRRSKTRPLLAMDLKALGFEDYRSQHTEDI